MRAAIPSPNYAFTLHLLALNYALRRKAVSDNIYDTCEAIWSLLQPIYLRLPSTLPVSMTMVNTIKYIGHKS